MGGDNYKVHIISEKRDAFEMGMSLMMRGMNARYFAVTKRWGLILFWFVDKNEGMRTEHTFYDYNNDGKTYVEEYRIQRFDKDMSVGEAIPFVKDWLVQQDYGPRQDIDGDSSQGFEICTGEGWFAGIIGDHRGALGFIRPTWIYYGK